MTREAAEVVLLGFRRGERAVDLARWVLETSTASAVVVRFQAAVLLKDVVEKRWLGFDPSARYGPKALRAWIVQTVTDRLPSLQVFGKFRLYSKGEDTVVLQLHFILFPATRNSSK